MSDRAIYECRPLPYEYKGHIVEDVLKEAAELKSQQREESSLTREQKELLLLYEEILDQKQKRMNATIILDKKPTKNIPTFSGANEGLRRNLKRAGLLDCGHFVWVEGAESSGEIIFNDSPFLHKVFIAKGNKENPEIEIVPHQSKTKKKPHYTRKDGKIIIYVDSFSGGGITWIRALEEVTTYKLPGGGTQGVWCPDGDYIAISHFSPPCFTILEYDEGEETLSSVGTSPNFVSTTRDCAWNPDGDRIAVARINDELRIMAFNKETETISEIVVFETDGDVLTCAWNPDGDRIAIGYNESPHFSILEFNKENGTISETTTFEYSSTVQGVDWHPDGDRIALANSGQDTPVIILSFDKNEGTVSQVASADMGWGLFGRSAAWHPDGDKLLVTQQSGDGIAYFTFNKENDTLTLISNWYNLGTFASGQGTNDCAWSSDKSTIAISGDTFGNPGFWLLGFNPDTEEAVLLDTFELEHDGHGCHWHPDKNLIAVAHYGEDFFRILRAMGVPPEFTRILRINDDARLYWEHPTPGEQIEFATDQKYDIERREKNGGNWGDWVSIATEIDDTNYTYNSEKKEYRWLDNTHTFELGKEYEYRIREADEPGEWGDPLGITWYNPPTVTTLSVTNIKEME